MPAASFRVIPVIDLKEGMVVHAIRGQRQRYQPVQGVLTASPKLADVVEAMSSKLGLTQFYLADLDAIEAIHAARLGPNRNQLPAKAHKASLNLKQLEELIRQQLGRLGFMVDAGANNLESARTVLAAGAAQVIIGTETLFRMQDLELILANLESNRVIMSLDSRQGQILGLAPELAGLTPPQALEKLLGLGARHFILLELDRVGSQSGPDQGFLADCLRLLEAHRLPGLEPASLLVGGGVSGYDDLKQLQAAGAAGALVATALHNGSLTRQHIEALGG